MEALRLAALKLYGAAPSDRAWILSQFDRRTRRQLKSLLRDLEDSGIAPETLGGIDQADLPGPEREPEVAESLVRLNGADPRAIERAIEAEPAWVIATILDAHAWTWRDAVVKRLKRKKVLGDRLPRTSPTPAVTSALIASLARRVGEASGFEETMHGRREHSGVAGVWTKVRSWIS
jgi:hypothetical protein